MRKHPILRVEIPKSRSAPARRVRAPPPVAWLGTRHSGLRFAGCCYPTWHRTCTVLAPSYFCLLSPSLYTVATGVVLVHGPFCFISCPSLAMRLTAWLRAVWSLAPTNHHVTQCSENATTATPKPPHALATGQPHTHDTTYTLYMYTVRLTSGTTTRFPISCEQSS